MGRILPFTFANASNFRPSGPDPMTSGAYVLFSFALLLVFGLTVLVEGASGSMLLGFLLVWLIPTYLLSRVWRR